MALVKVNESVCSIFGILEQYGNRQYACGPVSFLEHACQTAMLAEEETKDEELILAAFFHDIGHFCRPVTVMEAPGNNGAYEHEKQGARFLNKAGFSGRIVTLVENHVLAKRYLTCKYPDFYLALSEAAKESLEYQGGPMCMEEAGRFEAHPLFNEIIRLRRWDEAAKQPGKQTQPLLRYRYMTMFHLICQANGCLV
jgi:2-amino-1-hydroxyethylphosphonate dioxygenase (glycine-forming)